MSERFTKKQRALLDACAINHENMGDGVKVLCFMGSNNHSFATAKSLEHRGYLSIDDNNCGEAWASFSSEGYSDYVELFHNDQGGES